jgi:hypothetical protein
MIEICAYAANFSEIISMRQASVR